MGGRRQRRHRALAPFAVVAMLVGLGACTVADETDATRSGDRSTSSPTGSEAPVSGEQSTPPTPGRSSSAPAVGAPAPVLSPGRDTTVSSITDGDTLRISGGERIRLIGIDTPEVSGGVECFGRQATAAITRLVPPGTPIRLVGDVEATDRYGRTLSYVYRRADARFVNLALAADGFATVLTIPPNVAHAEDFRRAAGDARNDRRGLWSACAGTDPQPPTSTTTPPPPAPPPAPAPVGPQPVAPPAPPGGSRCDPSYPTTCIPPGPPDLDCGDVPDRRFTVIGPDPHGFDGNHDGVGCET